MDRTDRFINNRAPKKLVVIFLLLLLLSFCTAYFISGKCADTIVRGQIRSELAIAGGGKLMDYPDENDIAAGEALMSRYSIDRDKQIRIGFFAASAESEQCGCHEQAGRRKFVEFHNPVILS